MENIMVTSEQLNGFLVDTKEDLRYFLESLDEVRSEHLNDVSIFRYKGGYYIFTHRSVNYKKAELLEGRKSIMFYNGSTGTARAAMNMSGMINDQPDIICYVDRQECDSLVMDRLGDKICRTNYSTYTWSKEGNFQTNVVPVRMLRADKFRSFCCKHKI